MIRPIFQKLAHNKPIWIVALLVGAIWIGCNTSPFEVVGPGGLSQETGSALVTAQIPSFSRGLILRVRLGVSSVDSDLIRNIERDMNFPIPGGNLSVGQVADIPTGKRRFTVTAFDTDNILRFRGSADSTITVGQTELIQVNLNRVGGTVDFRTVIDLARIDTSKVDSVTLAGLPTTSILDILEVITIASHPQLTMLPLLSVGLGDQFSVLSDGTLSRRIRVSQLPTGRRRFVAHLRDLSSGGTRAFADTINATIDTIRTTEAVFRLRRVESSAGLLEVFNKTTLPRDSTVVVVTPVF